MALSRRRIRQISLYVDKEGHIIYNERNTLNKVLIIVLGEKGMKSKKEIIKMVVITVLVVALAAETVFLIFGRKKSPDTASADSQTVSVQTEKKSIDMSALTEKIGEKKGDIGEVVKKSVQNCELASDDIVELAKDIVYSNTFVNIIMSIAYPLCYDILFGLDMLDFAQSALLYPTGPEAATRFENSSYTCIDRDGQRKPLSQVLNAVGDDWTYMDYRISLTDSDGNASSTALWNTVDWGVTDEESFFKAMGDMSEIMRGVLEVCLQGRELTVRVNVFEALMGKPILPINLNAAELFNSEGKSGYSSCLIPLFNMLGLVEGEYPADGEFCAYESFSDLWKAILRPVFRAVEKLLDGDVIQNLTNLLVNFVDAIESHSLCDNMVKMGLMSDFHFLATAAMGLEDAEIFNLGETLIDTMGTMGLEITGDFNALLDSLIRLLSKSETSDLPDMDVIELLAYTEKTTLSNGNIYLVADSEKVINFLIDYVMQKEVMKCLLDVVGISDTDAATYFLTTFGTSEKVLAELVKSLVPIIVGGE